MVRGCGCDLILNIILTLLAYIPGDIYKHLQPYSHTRWFLRTRNNLHLISLSKKGAPFSGEIGSPFESRWDALLFQPELFGPLFPIPKCSYPKSLIIIIRATINPVVIHQTECWIISLQAWSTPFGSPSSLTQQTLRPELTLPIPTKVKIFNENYKFWKWSMTIGIVSEGRNITSNILDVCLLNTVVPLYFTK